MPAPVLRATNLDVPMPYAQNLENEVILTEARVEACLRSVLYMN